MPAASALRMHDPPPFSLGKHNTAVEFAIMSIPVDVNARTNCVIRKRKQNLQKQKGNNPIQGYCPLMPQSHCRATY